MSRPAALSLGLLLAAASAASAQVTLSPKHDEGVTTRRFNLNSSQTLKIADQEVQTASDVTVDTRSEVGRREPDGRVRMRETIQRVRLKLSLPGNVMVDFDSDGPEVKSPIAELQMALDGLRALKGQGYTLVLERNHRVAAVEGLEKLIDGVPEASRETIKGALNAEKVKREANQGYEALPDRPVRKGDRWQRTQTTDIGGGQTLTFETFYEYDGTVEREGRSLHRINVFAGSVRYDQDPNVATPLKVTRADLQLASSSGSILFDAIRGLVVESRFNCRVQGPMAFSIDGMDLPGNADLTLDTSTLLVK